MESLCLGFASSGSRAARAKTNYNWYLLVLVIVVCYFVVSEPMTLMSFIFLKQEIRGGFYYKQLKLCCAYQSPYLFVLIYKGNCGFSHEN